MSFPLKKIAIFVSLFFSLGLSVVFAATRIERASVSTLGVQGDFASTVPYISSDGRYVAFSSEATNLVVNDTNGVGDIFVFDSNNDSIERISISTLGVEGDQTSTNPSISSDGRYVAFGSEAATLILDDTNGMSDIFVYDRQTDTIERVSVDDAGVEGDGTSATPSISADGRYVAFSSESTNLVAGDTNLMADIFVYDRQTDTIERVSVDDAGVEGDGTSATPSISADGRYVAFGSESANLVAGDTNGVMDIFVYDRQTDTIERVSVDDAGVEGDLASQAQAISADGRYIALTSRATNLVAGDTNGVNDIFVYDRQTDTIERVSVSSLGVQGNAEAFFQVTISADGRYVGFVSNASNLVAGDTNFSGDTFIYDRNTDTIERASMNNQGVEGDATSIASVSISSTGRYITFASVATNLVAGDTNGVADIFLYDREYEIVESISESSPSNFSSGYITPHINIEGYATMTDSRIVELVVWSPISISNYVISNDPDFSHAEAYARETLEKHLYWDICKNSTQCAPGTKRIYVRFYNGANFIGEHFVDIDYSLKRECPYFKEYLRKGTKNIREEVIKAQEFLNRELGISLVVDGIFGQETDKAVRAFQEKYSTQIILPWAGLDHSTGWWYITTSAFANILVGC